MGRFPRTLTAVAGSLTITTNNATTASALKTSATPPQSPYPSSYQTVEALQILSPYGNQASCRVDGRAQYTDCL